MSMSLEGVWASRAQTEILCCQGPDRDTMLSGPALVHASFTPKKKKKKK
uniref:Alternative protein LRRC48 n=1 Tax=Homo sapiens TaxID=9606 RepID=L8E869_HUMAN|nr:alternative protein LRRC48 [Homo sapiens]